MFKPYAPDVETCPIEGSFRSADLLKVIQPHVLGSATLSGTYSLYPAVKA